MLQFQFTEVAMNLEDLAKKIGAKVISHGKSVPVEINRIYAGDRISDLLNQAVSMTLVVSNLASSQLIRVAQLMDLPGICLLEDMVPDPEMIRIATEHRTLLMVSPRGMFETCGRMYQVLLEESRTGL
jgi:hypothetical protein